MEYRCFAEDDVYAIPNIDMYCTSLNELCEAEQLDIKNVLEYQYFIYLLHLEQLGEEDAYYTLEELQVFWNTIVELGMYIFGCARIVESYLNRIDHEL